MPTSPFSGEGRGEGSAGCHTSPQAIRLPASTVHKIEHGDRRIDPIEFIRWCRACDADPGKTLNQLKP